jgi:heme exporter protein B
MTDTARPNRRRRGRAQGPALESPASIGSAPGGMALRVRQVGLLIGKDLLTELRTRDTITTLLFFALLMVVIFVFSFSANEEVGRQVSSGVLWIAIAFAGTLAIDRSFTREQEGNTLTALVLIPGVTRALFIAKTALNLVYLTLVELLVVPLTLTMLGVSVPDDALLCFVCALATGTVGFVIIGTVISAMLVAIRRRGVLLPIVLYPIAIPLLVMGVEATSIVLENQPLEQGWSWVKIMAAIDVVYLFGGAWLFGLVIEEE